ncbi:agmatine deiminase [Limosilactobacillus fermentum]|uniref:agmatine deiminase n=1 Tax=Limosilactobacillus fermentum TaxID=1613 RepID=UPI00209066F1|nr:agmatine deiminase [Limosilactobacillus fermentum]UVF13650.1 agmatine deiminase [Limosilactobacillus fermentum]
MEKRTLPVREHYRLVAEFDPQQESLMVWPQRPDNWRDGGKPAQKAYAALANLIAEKQPVTVFVQEDQYQNARVKLNPTVRIVEMSSNDAWIKDYGPFYIRNEHSLRAVDFNFNAWGGLIDGLYFPWDKDNEMAIKIANLFRTDYYRNSVVLEGCAIHTDGQGTFFATTDVVLASDRNPQMTKVKMERILHDYLGALKVIWLDHGYFLDETGGDIDNIMNVVRPGEVVLTWTDNPTDPTYESCRQAERILQAATDAQGRKIKVHRLVMPRVLTLTSKEAATVDCFNGSMPRDVGQRLTATYVSYVTTNQQIIVPEFDDPQDTVAKKQLACLYPGREVVGFPVREILIGGGGLHTIVTAIPSVGG